MKKSSSTFLIFIAIIGLVLGGIILTSAPKSSSTQSSTTANPPVDAKALYNDAAPTVGTENSVVKVVVFSDYLCPYCKTAHGLISDATKKYGDKVSVTHRTLIIHSGATIMAQAAEAANLQGKFQAMDDALFSQQPASTNDAMIALAKNLGLDVGKFTTDLTSDAITKRIAQDNADATTLQLKGTPSIFINGVELDDPSTIDAAISAQLNK